MPAHCRTIFLLIAVTLVPRAFCQSDAANKQRSEQLKRLFNDVAEGYAIEETSSTPPQSLVLHDKPVMHWLSLDGSTGKYLGSVFTWTQQDRPEVIGTIFTSDVTKEQLPVCTEIYSFSMKQLVVRSEEGNAWQPDPTLSMQPVPDAPVPASSKQGRRLQLRSMARKFSGRMNRRGVDHPLRLLPRPVYEYECDTPEVVGGALLVLVAYNTDPDILLLLEARQTADGPMWFFQPARFSDKSLWLAYEGQDVWESMRQGHGTDAAHSEDRQYHVHNATLDAPIVQVNVDSVNSSP